MSTTNVAGPRRHRLTAAQSSAQFTDTLGLTRLDVSGLSMLLYPASEVDAGLANLYLRVSGADPVPLLGPASVGSTRERDGVLLRTGRAGDLAWTVAFSFSDAGDQWRWAVRLHNAGTAAVEADVVATHDIALASYGAVRTNEYYVSQYLDLTPVLHDEFGTAIAVRQNMPGERQPWAVLGCLGRGTSWATDALQLRRVVDGRAVLDVRELPSARLQHEHTLATLASEPLTIEPGAAVTTGFFGAFQADHPAATGPDDAAFIAAARESARSALALVDGAPVADADAADEARQASGSLFDAPVADAAPLREETASRWFGQGRTLVEAGPGGELWGFVTDAGANVVSAAKEAQMLRPHGHILRTGDSLTPETGVLTSTVWMRGVFASQVTVGHVSINKLISGDRTYLGLQQGHGVRMFVRRAGQWALLGVPTAWSLQPHTAIWCYDLEGAEVVVRATAATEEHRIDLAVQAEGVEAVKLAVQVALGGDDGQEPGRPAVESRGSEVVVGAPGTSFTLAFAGATPQVAGDEDLLSGGSVGLPYVTCTIEEPASFEVRLTADVTGADELPAAVRLPDVWDATRERLALSGGGRSEDVAALDAILPWFTHNAFVHYLSPRGLEQYTGGGWGTRDVCQGPVGLLTAYASDPALKDVLLRVFRDQNARGDWPQAFDFLPMGGEVGQWDSHGDVVFWPVLAAGEYLLGTGDAGLLDAEVPFRGDGAFTEPAPVREHLLRAIARIEELTVPGTPLPAYGHGDWNDSLQPADKRLAKQMASTWTSTLQAHALTQLAAGLRAAGVEEELAERCADLAGRTAQSMRELLLADGVLSGYGVFADGSEAADVELLVHPRDTRTGLTYGVLPWIHAISADLLSPEDARHHLDLLHEHLWGPDGARLFDKPPAYRGGPMEVFQRAEAATFWGREIGLMYTHAHLRYCEALARFGDARGLFDGLLLVVPKGQHARVPQLRPRQDTCYFSSSDAVFADRYEAAERYDGIARGEVELEGGWRIYSSGPGLFLRILVECVLGVRRRADRVELDPVLDPGLDGLTAQVPFEDGALSVRYLVQGDGVGVRRVRVDGTEVATEPLNNPYRAGGVSVPRSALHAGAAVEIEVGA